MTSKHIHSSTLIVHRHILNYSN